MLRPVMAEEPMVDLPLAVQGGGRCSRWPRGFLPFAALYGEHRHRGRVHAFVTFASSGLDETIFRALNLAGTDPVLDRIFVFFTILTGVYVIFLVAVPLWLKGLREATFDVLLVLGITILVSEAIKYLVGRARPCDTLSNVRTLAGYRCSAEFDPAFPSGHASRAFAVAGFLTVRFRWKVGVPAGAVAVLAGLSRVYLGLHWPSDILGGAVVGIALALLVEYVSRRVGLYQRIRRRIVEAIPHLRRRTA
ncbi:MAG: phosphatase PAP2 family protein [Methanobacteriota archaeon]|nr:MAG: phosphatase PAP2 family protein [Euryarchaeota archaeon]